MQEDTKKFRLKTAGFHLGYRPGLDGLRGVAILLVLAVHGNILGNMFSFMGVSLFFVLSGFLITCLMLKEHHLTGTIGLKGFYMRRALRLFPALICMLSLFVVHAFATGTRGDAIRDLREALVALLYLTNLAKTFEIGHSDFLAHSWSLSLEEQFYLIWPLILLRLLRRCSRPSSIYLLMLGIMSSCLIRFMVIAGTTASPVLLSYRLDVRADSLLVGCVLAFLLPALGQKPTGPGLLLRYGGTISLIGLLVVAPFLDPYSGNLFGVDWLIIAICGSLVIAQLLLGRKTLLHRLLENPALVYLGRISYGLYIWHYPIFRGVEIQGWPWWKYALVAFPLTGLATLVSYYFIETPCLRFKLRYQSLAVSHEKALASAPIP